MKQAEINETETGIMRALISKREEKASTPPSASDRREGRGGEEGGEKKRDAMLALWGLGSRQGSVFVGSDGRWDMGGGRRRRSQLASRNG